MIRVIILRTAGTNCDHETAFAFERAGAKADLVHINSLRGAGDILERYHILAIPGGFTYGDDIASGKILANELKFMLEDSLQRFIAKGKLVIGICNGFQVLVKSCFLPNLSGNFQSFEATLTLNDSDKFEDRWVHLKSGHGSRVTGHGKCVWTWGLPEMIQLPVAHAEGKFVPRDAAVLRKLKREGLVVFTYVDGKGKKAAYPANPNGSVEAIAGICDRSGRIFGLMPHPERFIDRLQHPSWTRHGKKAEGDGLAIFRSGVDFAKKHL